MFRGIERWIIKVLLWWAKRKLKMLKEAVSDVNNMGLGHHFLQQYTAQKEKVEELEKFFQELSSKKK